eukprot:696289_1
MSDLKGSSDLMNRLGSFLPKMAAANEELDKTLAHHASSSLNGTKGNGKGEGKGKGNVATMINPLQIDSELKKEAVGEDGESEDENGDDQSVGDEQQHQQTIEMTVALG